MASDKPIQLSYSVFYEKYSLTICEYWQQPCLLPETTLASTLAVSIVGHI